MEQRKDPTGIGPNIAVTLGHGAVYQDVVIHEQDLVDHLKSQGMTPEDIDNTTILLSDAVIKPEVHSGTRRMGSYQRWDTHPGEQRPLSTIMVYSGPLIEQINEAQRSSCAAEVGTPQVAQLSGMDSQALSEALLHEATHHIRESNPARKEESRQSPEPPSGRRTIRAAEWIAVRANRLLTSVGIVPPEQPQTPFEAYQNSPEEKACTEAEHQLSGNLVEVTYRMDYATGEAPYEPPRLPDKLETAYVRQLLRGSDNHRRLWKRPERVKPSRQ
jgi:hypothetical protein